MDVASTLDRYRHLSRLGSGGMSTVELAEDTVLGRRVALKRMHTPDDVSGHSRLRREALIGASLTHPNLVSIFDILTTEDGDDVIVMEYVEGQTLAEALRAGKPDVSRALQLLTGVSAALDAIHEQGIVHRDVKPANILLGIDGSIKLADLGIAAVADRTRITTAGAVLGTFSYMAPEQLEGVVATPAVDVYALSAVAYEVLSGKKARNEPNPVALAHAISTQPPPDLRSEWPQAPAEVAELLVRGMSRDPGARPRSAGDLTGRLKAALEPERTLPIKPPAPLPRRRRKPESALREAAPVAAGAAAGAAAAAEGPVAAPPPARPSPPPGRVRRVPPPLPVRRTRPRAGVLAAAAVALAAVIAAVIVLASAGGSQRPTTAGGTKSSSARTGGAKHSHGQTAAATVTGSPSPTAAAASGTGAASGTPASSGGSATIGVPGAGSPVGAVESFYHLAASHQYPAAWALADPAFRAQLAGYPSFQSSQAGDRSITFTNASVVNQTGSTATVSIRTRSVRDNGTQNCSGTVDLVRSGSSSWLLHQIHINCI